MRIGGETLEGVNEPAGIGPISILSPKAVGPMAKAPK